METKMSDDEAEIPQKTTSNEEAPDAPLNRMLFDADVPHHQRYFGTNASNLFEDRIAVSKLSELNVLDEDTPDSNDWAHDKYKSEIDRTKVYNRVLTSTAQLRGLTASEIETFISSTSTLTTCYDAGSMQNFFKKRLPVKYSLSLLNWLLTSRFVANLLSALSTTGSSWNG